MTNSQSSPHDVALKIAQQAVWILAKWAGAELPENWFPDDCDATVQAKEKLWNENKDMFWSKDRDIQLTPLRLLFDKVNLSPSPKKDNPENYFLPISIRGSNPQIPYPVDKQRAIEDIQQLQKDIRRNLKLENLNNITWNKLPILTLIIEKLGSYVSFNDADIAVVDMARSTAAVAAALASNHEAKELCLIAGDLSGIQKFIYTISSDGALKSLRARSFYLELVTEEVVQQILQKLELPRTNVIYAGGGNLYILADKNETKKKVEEVRKYINYWLKDEFQGKVFLALDCLEFPTKNVSNHEFATHWAKVTKDLAKQKSRKFADEIEDLIKPHDSYIPCKVCHRDDTRDLKPLNEDSAVEACPTCRQMFNLGGKLLKAKAILRSSERKNISDAFTLKFKFENRYIYYHVFKHQRQIEEIQESETLFLVNDWMIYRYRAGNVVPLLLGNYAQKSEEERGGIIRSEEMAARAKGISRVGYLRMDVDRLGQIFAKGLCNKQTLPRIAGLSRNMSYFFKVYLNSLAATRKSNIPENIKQLTPEDEPLNLLFIYAGGDDLFVSGAWNEVVEFAFDIYQSFRAYTGHNPDITLSGGISIDEPKFPLYQAAKSSGSAEDAAKDNGRDSLGLFGEVFKWEEWIKIEDLSKLLDDKKFPSHLESEAKPEIFGILSFVKQLTEQLDFKSDYSRSFIRSLLDTAEAQEIILKKKEEQQNDIRYYLHLPKLAYAFSRLPATVRDKAEFAPVRQSLMSPLNAPYFRAIATWIELLNR